MFLLFSLLNAIQLMILNQMSLSFALKKNLKALSKVDTQNIHTEN